MVAAGAKVAYEKDGGVGWLCILVLVSSAATIYQLYWDFVKDWGLLQMNSDNPWLRNELMLRRKIIYYFSMVYISSSSLFLYSKISNISFDTKYKLSKRVQSQKTDLLRGRVPYM